MKISRRGRNAFILLGICIAIHLFSRDSSLVESVYSNGFYENFAGILRTITGRIPFSIGDLVYGTAVIWMILKLIRWIRKKGRSTFPFRIRLENKLITLVTLFSTLYILFNVFWGINYNRVGVAQQLRLEMAPYTQDDLKLINCELITKANTAKANWLAQGKDYPGNKELFRMVATAYDTLGARYPYLRYETPSIKPALWGFIGSYGGFTGYYNPFTGEAQVNTLVPKFLQPFVTCHEVAHQVGYAKEMEANFVGYLASAASPEPLLQYSVYLDLFVYANRNLARTDSSAAKLYRKELSPAIHADIEEWRKFSREHRSPFEAPIRWLYGKFLQSNQQPQGILSYDEVTGFVIAYYKQFRKL